MKTLFRYALAAGTLLSLSFAQTYSSDSAMIQAKKYIAQFYKSETAELWKDMTPEMQAALKTQADLTNFSAQVKSQLGQEATIDNERVMPGPHAQIYTRLTHFAQVPMPIEVLMSFDDEGRVAGFFIRPEKNSAESKYLDYKDKTTFNLPLKGTWLVYQGGRSTYDNYHAEAPDQRFAYDIVGFRDGKLYAANGDKLEDYFCFGQTVFAPADAVVAKTIDQYDDNPLLKPLPNSPPYGNTVVLDHGDGEFSMLAHLKRGSVKVKIGDKVKTGLELAQCGNSGNSPFPHLHYHLQTTAEWFKGDGLPLQLHDYTADGKAVSIGEPVRGQVIQSK
jgi:hypothetical protein